MYQKATQTLKNLENKIHFLKTDIPHQSGIINRDFIEILSNISTEVEKTIKILQKNKVESNQLIN